MIYLPLVERELRLAARRKTTYWTRFWAGLVVVVIAFFMIVGFRRGTAQLGQAMFGVLTVLAFACCLLAGVRYTADCLSEEKREGTLGFLFLTDLRGYDVVFGKLVVTSLDAVYALLAIVPVLGLPLLLGGVSGLEFWRVGLLLLNTLLFSLAIGLLISALGRNERTVMLTTFFAVIFFAFAMPALWKLATSVRDSRWFDLVFLMPSPSYAFKMAASATGLGAREYWLSMGTILALSLVCVGASSFGLPRVFQESVRSIGTERWVQRFRRWRFRTARGREGKKAGLIGTHPFLWVLTRDRLPRIFLGVFVGVVICFGIWAYPILAKKNRAFMSIAMFTAYGFHILLKFLVAAEACRRINEDKRTGALDLLLSTRLTIGSILGAQFLALKRFFWLPVLSVVALNIEWMHAIAENEPNWVIFGGAVILIFDFFALSWVGMRVALRGQRYHRAVLGTFGRVMLPAWGVLAGFIFISMNGGVGSRSASSFFFWWLVFSALYDLALVSWARAGFEREVPMAGPPLHWSWVPLRDRQS